MAFKLVVSDPRSRKSYQKEGSGEGLLGKRVGEKFSGSTAGIEGYELEITGGSDKDGFPMRKDVDGTGRKRVLLSSPPGFHPKSKGQRKRKSVRGNTVSEDIVQINSKVVKYGSKAIDQLLGTRKEEGKKQGKEKTEEEAPEKDKAGEKASEEQKAEGKTEDKAAEDQKETETPKEEAAEKQKGDAEEQEKAPAEPGKEAAEGKEEKKPKD